ncbi:MAG: four-helix bundle copper-binding protein [Chitinophagaceae bacterium]|nr:four-helix bundle copper-binding protein [Chitinophagaceae bacterium]
MSHEQNKGLLDALNNCAAECNHCATACLDEQDVKMLARCIKLDIDCADICMLTASYVARGSEHAEHLKKECAEICNACAEECEKHAKMGMEHCRKCAEACRKCAEACSGIAA